MSEALRDVFRHNSWANRALVDYCATSLSPAQLAISDSAVYGSIEVTLRHLLGAEAFYWSMFSGGLPSWAQPDEQAASLEQMWAWAENLERLWHELLQQPVDAGAVLISRREGRPDRHMRAAMLLVQAVHHGNVHREQVCHLITSLGLQPPDVSAYAWEREGRP